MIDIFSKIRWPIPLTKKNAQTIKDSFESNLIISKKTILIEAHRGKEVYNHIFQKFLNNTNIKHFSRNRSSGAVFAGRFSRTIADLLEKPVFQKNDGNWIDVFSVKQNNTIFEYIFLLNQH